MAGETPSAVDARALASIPGRRRARPGAAERVRTDGANHKLIDSNDHARRGFSGPNGSSLPWRAPEHGRGGGRGRSQLRRTRRERVRGARGRTAGTQPATWRRRHTTASEDPAPVPARATRCSARTPPAQIICQMVASASRLNRVGGAGPQAASAGTPARSVSRARDAAATHAEASSAPRRIHRHRRRAPAPRPPRRSAAADRASRSA